MTLWLVVAGMITFNEQALEIGKRISVVGFCHFEGEQLVVASGDSIKAGVVIFDDEQAARVNPNKPALGFRLQSPHQNACCPASTVCRGRPNGCPLAELTARLSTVVLGLHNAGPC